MKKVVTWQTFGANSVRINICNPCALKLRRAQQWPRHNVLGEYGQVYRGQHVGECDLCQKIDVDTSAQ